jgi:formylglycine-generating enzyme required for sulfatase activity
MRMLRETPGFSVGDADDPSKRYVDMQGVITALETGLAGGSLPSRSRLRSWVQRAFSSSTSVSPLGSVGEFAQSIQGDVRSLASAAHEALSRRGPFDQASGDSDLRILTAPIRLALIRVPAGKFLMGSDPDLDDDAGDREGPQHCVGLPEFYIGKYPITHAQYETFVQSTGYRAPTDWENDRVPAGRRDHPVVYVSWSDVGAVFAMVRIMCAARRARGTSLSGVTVTAVFGLSCLMPDGTADVDAA